ncbi:HutD family protein [Motiliproteus sp. MSK22-1]|uniref:HutD/Ves family protein n=1 Tax=Motiliproteus sp. MSK22-1 TaxID=1897630 RepID=UPI001300FCFC|nr:HutD family protein [Motiliproteus sp. MSK22-1]
MKNSPANIRHHRFNNYPMKPWKNGQGSTLEAASSCDQQGNADGRWRVSIALLNENSAYSDFCGYTRSQLMLEGEPVTLTVQQSSGTEQRIVMQPLSLLRFDGGAEVCCDLRAPGVKMFNLMSRDNKTSHVLEALYSADLPARPDSSGEALLIFTLSTNVELQVGQQGYSLGQFDLLEVQQPEGQVICVQSAVGGDVSAIIVRIGGSSSLPLKPDEVSNNLAAKLEQL